MGSVETVTVPDIWPEPKSISVELLPVESFNLKLLPESLRSWVEDCSYRMDNSPHDYLAIGVMVALAATIGNKAVIYPKANDDWVVVPNLWGLAIGRPSSKKTPMLKEACAAIFKMDEQSGIEFDDQIKMHQVDSQFFKLLADSAQSKSKDLVKKGNKQGARQVLEKACEEEPEEPIRHRRYTNDATIEKLGELLNENPHGLLVFRDEIIGWLRSMDREDRAQDRAFHLEGWAGLNGFTFDRIGRGTISIKTVIISILGGIQPGKLKSYLLSRQSGSGDDGLLERFQLAVYPDIGDLKLVDQHQDGAEKQRVMELFDKLDQMEPDQYFRFDAEAQVMFNQWYQENLEKCKSCEDIHLESLLGKYSSLVASLSLIIHLAEGSGEKVGIGSIIKATGWCEYLESHARRINGLIDNPAVRAQVLEAKLKELPNPFTPRQVLQKGWGGLNNTCAIENTLDYLCDAYYLKKDIERPAGGGRPSIKYHINPRVL